APAGTRRVSQLKGRDHTCPLRRWKRQARSRGSTAVGATSKAVALGNRQGGGAWSIFLGEQGVAKTVEKTCLEIECLFEGTLLPQTDKRYWVRLLSSDARPALWILRDELLRNPRRRPKFSHRAPPLTWRLGGKLGQQSPG